MGWSYNQVSGDVEYREWIQFIIYWIKPGEGLKCIEKENSIIIQHLKSK